MEPYSVFTIPLSFDVFEGDNFCSSRMYLVGLSSAADRKNGRTDLFFF